MENWGLITYRTALLLRNEQNTQRQIEAIASVVVHEISHMWCGNLVTMEFWNELFLKEGWATFFAVHTTDVLFPEWRLWEKQERSKHKFLLSDSLVASPALIQNVNSPSEVDSMFNLISYTKGGALYKMLYEFMGMETFQKWMRYHYKKFAYKSTVTNDLFTSLNQFLPQVSVSDLRTWTDKAGYPIVQVNEIIPGRFILSQKRFYSEVTNQPDNRTWWIPVTVMDSKGKVEKFTFSTRNSNPFALTNSWFKLNKNQHGIYRVSYPERIWKNLISAIASKDRNLSELDILGLADDIYALAGTGDVSIKYSLDLSIACNEDRSNGVFDALVENMREISNRIVNKPNQIKEKYQRFARKVFEFNIRRLGWERRSSDSHDDIQNRILLLTEAAHFEDKEVIAECIERFNTNRIPNDLKQLISDSAVKYGDVSVFRSFLEKFRTSTSEAEKDVLLKSLSQTQTESNIEMILDIIMSDAVRAQDGSTYFNYMVSFNQKTPLKVWNYFKVNFDAILKKFSAPIVDSRILQFVTSQFDSKEMHDDVESFMKTRSSSPYIKLYLSNILKRQKYIQTIYEDFEKYFE
jgi:aminopeptidase N